MNKIYSQDELKFVWYTSDRDQLQNPTAGNKLDFRTGHLYRIKFTYELAAKVSKPEKHLLKLSQSELGRVFSRTGSFFRQHVLVDGRYLTLAWVIHILLDDVYLLNYNLLNTIVLNCNIKTVLAL